MIAIVSYVSKGNYDHNTADENQILKEILQELGIESELVPWSDPKVNWAKYSCLLIKSTWDYFDHYEEFKEWIAKITALGIPTLNSLETLLWNSNKNYLFDIQEAGFNVISGRTVKEIDDVRRASVEINYPEVIFKPKVSGGAKNTFRVRQSNIESVFTSLEPLLEKEEFLMQPYIPEVAEVGEYSLIFFNGQYSHAVLKVPAQGDFRVQHYFGGTIKQIEPDVEMLSQAEAIIKEFAVGTLYARVDGIKRGDEFHLMELELIEPYLFLEEGLNAKANYQNALSARLI